MAIMSCTMLTLQKYWGMILVINLVILSFSRGNVAIHQVWTHSLLVQLDCRDSNLIARSTCTVGPFSMIILVYQGHMGPVYQGRQPVHQVGPFYICPRTKSLIFEYKKIFFLKCDFKSFYTFRKYQFQMCGYNYKLYFTNLKDIYHFISPTC